MKRKIIKIDESLCDGCGQCVDACAEGAIRLIEGKAKLVSEVYCDGLGACIGECPVGALTIIEQEAADFDEKAVERHLASPKAPAPAHRPTPLPTHSHAPHFGGCPGSAVRTMLQDSPEFGADEPAGPALRSQLGHWPVQLMLVPPQAPFLRGADILVCADCVPFAYPDFHRTYLKGKAVLVGCPKLDDLDYYREKLKAIIAEARPRSITVLKMEVPCCGGIAFAVREARDAVMPELPIEQHTIGIRGDLLERTISTNRGQSPILKENVL